MNTKRGEKLYEKYQKLKDGRGVTDYRVSEATGIPRSTFSEWKRGTYVPKIEKIIKIAKFFDVPVDYFLQGLKEQDQAAGAKR